MGELFKNSYKLQKYEGNGYEEYESIAKSSCITKSVHLRLTLWLSILDL